MAEFNRKNTYNFWHSPIALISLFCILVLFSYNIIGLIEKGNETARKKELMLANIESLRKRESSISTDIEKLKTDEGVEEVIREKYQVAKEGEKMVVIIDPENQNTLVDKDIVNNHSFLGWIKKHLKSIIEMRD